MAKELLFSVTLKDCEVQTFRCGGPGGQKQNKASTGVRIIHHPSGARAESREFRSQHQNKRAAFMRMIDTNHFKVWVRRKASEHGRNLEAEVRDSMKPENLRVEAYNDGEWHPIP